MRIVMLQVNTSSGDFSENVSIIAEQARKAMRELGRSILCVVPAGALAGFP